MHGWLFLVLSLLLLTLPAVSQPRPDPVPIIFDTDMGNDIDDALALAMIHALESRGEVKLLAVTLTKDHPYAAEYVDIVNTFYGRPDIPIGVVKDGKTPKEEPMIAVPVGRKDSPGRPLYPRDWKAANAPNAVDVIRKTLQSQPDHSVVMVQVGSSTNLARLLDSDKDLIQKKVRLLSIMAGAFPIGKKEYNVYIDQAAALKLFEQWPTPIVASGFEIGLSILYPAKSIETDFDWTEHHPVADAYRAYKPMPYDRPTWDLTSVLYAARPDEGYFDLSPPGRVEVLEDGRTAFHPDSQGRVRHLIVRDEQRTRILDAMISLASQPPSR